MLHSIGIRRRGSNALSLFLCFFFLPPPPRRRSLLLFAGSATRLGHHYIAIWVARSIGGGRRLLSDSLPPSFLLLSRNVFVFAEKGRKMGTTNERERERRRMASASARANANAFPLYLYRRRRRPSSASLRPPSGLPNSPRCTFLICDSSLASSNELSLHSPALPLSLSQ